MKEPNYHFRIIYCRVEIPGVEDVYVPITVPNSFTDNDRWSEQRRVDYINKSGQKMEVLKGDGIPTFMKG